MLNSKAWIYAQSEMARSPPFGDLEDQDRFTFSTQREVVVMMEELGKL